MPPDTDLLAELQALWHRPAVSPIDVPSVAAAVTPESTLRKPALLPRPKPLGPPRCLVHVNAADWIDEPPRDGRIRTVCRICGTFIGFRPTAPERRQKVLDENADGM